MQKLRYSKEKFGFVVAFPNGTIGLYNHKVKRHLEDCSTLKQLEPYRLKTLTVDSNFHLSSPLIVWFEITRKCNLDCSHCYINAGEARDNELTLEEVKLVLDDLKDLGAFSIVFAGGEPYMRKDFPEILEYAAKLDFIIAVVTNGNFLTKKTLSRVPKNNCRITLSVDGIKSHTLIRGKSSTIELMGTKLALMKEMKIPCSVSTVITKQNIHELEDLLDWCIDNDVVFRTVSFNPLGRGLLNKKIHTLDKTDAAKSAQLFMMQKKFEGQKDKTIGQCVSKFFDYALTLMYMTKREHCSRSIGYIASNGDTYPCVTSASIEGFGGGNIRNSSFSSIWKNSFKEMRAITWEDFKVCNTCEFSGDNYFCSNRCPCMSLILNDELFGCGAGEFEKEDLRLRTKRLRTEMNYVY